MSNLSAPHFYNEEAAYEFLEARVWPHGAACPKCGERKRVSKMGGKSTRIFTMAFDMFRDLWIEKEESVEEDRAAIQRQIGQLERKFTQLVDRLVDAESQTPVSAYEDRLREMEDQKVFLTERLAETGKPRTPFKQAFRTAFDFLSNPWNLWASDRIEDKRAVLKLIFADQIAYCRKAGLRTAKTTYPFKALADFSAFESGVVSRAGFEPATR